MQTKRLLSLGLLSLILVSCGTGSGGSSSGGNRSVAVSSDCAQELTFFDELFRLTNLERTNRGLSALTLSSELIQAAQSHTKDMADNDYLSHTGLNGSTPGSRSNDTGYSSNYIGENIYAGGGSPLDAITWWMNSSNHMANILNTNYTEIGLGFAKNAAATYGTRWTQVFGNRPAAQKTPAPASALPASFASTCLQPDQAVSQPMPTFASTMPAMAVVDFTIEEPTGSRVPFSFGPTTAKAPEPAIATGLLFFAGLGIRSFKKQSSDD